MSGGQRSPEVTTIPQLKQHNFFHQTNPFKNSIQAFSVLKYKNHYVYVSMILYQKLYLSEQFLSHLVPLIHHENFSMSLNDI